MPEPRSMSSLIFFQCRQKYFAIEICEDLWTPVPPSSHHALAGADIILNLSASNEVLMKHKYRHELIGQQSARTVSAYVYSSCGYGESTQDLVFSGSSMIYENGSLLAESERFMMNGNLIAADIDIESLQFSDRNRTHSTPCLRTELVMVRMPEDM